MTGRGRTQPLDTFVKVPTFVHEAVATGELSPVSLALYVVLRSHWNSRNQDAYPSMARLARLMNMKNPRNLIKYMAELESIGAVVIRKENGASNRYSFPEPTSTSGDTGTSGDTAWAEWGDTTSTSGDTAPVPVEVLPGISGDTPTGTSGSTQTRSTELDQRTRSNERRVDTPAAPLRSTPRRGGPALQPPLMQAVPQPSESLPAGKQPRVFLEAKLGRELDDVEADLAASLHHRGQPRTAILSALQSLGVSA